ncbi:MAG: hypothetical protein RIS36_1931 [Pseudomonadota bacterium]|jgi:hypothetical protein
MWFLTETRIPVLHGATNEALHKPVELNSAVVGLKMAHLTIVTLSFF